MENVTRYKCQMSGCPFVSTIEAPVCEEHLAQIGQVFLETRSVTGTFLHLREMMREKQDRSLAEAKLIASRPHPDDPTQPFAECVYYVRIGDHIKTGTTTDLRQRLRSLYVDHDSSLLLAVEPGNVQVESRRHFEFADERLFVNRELFNPSRRLLSHINDIKREHGDPQVWALSAA